MYSIIKFKNVFTFILLILLSLISCKNDQKKNELKDNNTAQEAENVIEVTTNVMNFRHNLNLDGLTLSIITNLKKLIFSYSKKCQRALQLKIITMN
jgi:hypothetical protein